MAERKFIYLVMSLPKDSDYLFSKMADQEVPTHIYGVYSNMQSAVHCLYDLWSTPRVYSADTEYHIIKREVQSLFHRGGE